MKIINLDKEIFEQACNLCEKDFSYEEIFELLKNGSDVEKQIAILKINNIENKNYCQLLISHLTEQDGPIREVVAVKLNEFILKENCKIIDDKSFYPTFIDAVCDVNPNVSRLVIGFLPKLNFPDLLLKLLIEKIENIFLRIDNPDKEQKNFLTVRLFNLYWCLEAIGELLETQNAFEHIHKLNILLEKATSFNNYTIDEKIVRILASQTFRNEKISILDKIQNINNFYVKRFLNK